MIYKMIHFFLTFVAQSYSCHYSCLTCNGQTESDCLTCSEGITNQGKCSCSLGMYQSRICQSQCNQGYYQELDQCLECQYGCKVCQRVVCDECLQNFILVNSEFCSPHCEDGFYFLENNCVSSLLSIQVSTLIHQSFHDGLDQCELEAAKFNFDQIITGNMCDFYNNYVIFQLEGNKNQKEVSLYLSNLLKHQFIRLYLKVFFIGKQKKNDFLQILIDGVKIFQYQNQGDQNSQNTIIEIKTNSTHNKSDLNLVLKTQISSILGIHNLQIISDICGCQSCDNNDECIQSIEWNNICNNNQQLINQQCIDCEQLQNRMANCDCQIGYYLDENTNTCEKCQIQCLSCKYQSDYCTDCNLNRIDPFICKCIDGYYENDFKECQQCSQQCSTCYQKIDQCLKCKDSLLQPPHCQCQQNIVNNTDFYCQKCTKQEPIIELSTKLNQIIITFDSNFDLFSNQCSQIFYNETFITFGNNPLCQIFDNQIKIYLGNSFIYTKQTPIKLNNSNIIIKNCTQPLQLILPYYKLQQSQDQNLILNYNYIELTKKSEKTIIVITNLSKVFEQKWSIVYYEREYSQIQKLVENWNNQLDLFNFFISGNQFKQNNSINLTFYYCDFSYSCGFQNLSIKIEIETEITNELVILLQNSPIYEKQKLVIQIIYEDEQYIYQNLQTQSQLTFNYSIKGKNVDIQQSNVTLNLNQSYIINIENNQLINGEQYKIDVQGQSQNKKYSKNINFFAYPLPLNLKIYGGSKHMSFQLPLYISLTVNNNLLTTENNEFSQIIWSCKTLLENKNCITYQNEQIITINNQTEIYVEKFSFEPYSVIEIFVQAVQMNILYQDQVTYYFIEENLPELNIITNNQVENQYNNDYDKIQFKLELLQKDYIIDQCIFTGSIIFDYEIKSFYQLYYPEFKIQLSDYFDLQQNNLLIYKFSVLLPQFTMPSYSNIQLLFNSPPKLCKINIYENNTQFPKLYLISVNECKDENLPLQFRFSIYLFSYKNNQSQQIYLNNFNYHNKITTLLLNMMNSSQNITIIVDVLDIYLGLSHFQTEVSLNFQQFQDSDFILLKELFNEEQFFQQTNYLIQYLFQNNLKINSIILNDIVKNMTSENMKLIQIKLLLILSLSTIVEFDNFLQNKIDQLYSNVNNQININDGQQYFNQLIISQEQQDLLELINLYIIQQNNKNNRLLRRLIEEQNIQSSNLLQNFNQIGNILLKQQTPNEKKTEYQFESFQFSTLKVTDKWLNKSQIQIDLINNTILQIQQLGLTFNDLVVDFKQPDFQSGTHQMQMFDLKFQNETQISKIQNGSVSYEFSMDQNDDQNCEYHCVANINENWQENQCIEIIDHNKIKCQCKEIALTSIKQILINLKSNLYYIFSEKNFQNIKRLNYVEVMFFYIQLFLTIIYVWFLFYGKKLDQFQALPQQNKVYPIDKQTEAQLQKIKTLDNNENSPGRQHCNHIVRINITSNKETFRALKDTVTSNEQIQSEMNSPKSSSEIVNENVEQGKDIFTFQKNTSIHTDEKAISMVDMNTIITSKHQFFEVFSKFYKNYHKIIALYFKYDQNQSRPFRATLLYLSLLGQMSFINWFGEIYDPITLITLSLLSYVFGLVYKKMLACLISNQIILLQYVGFLTASLSVIFFIFVTVSTIPLYQNLFICNLWAVSYLISILIDLSLYTTLQILIMFLLLMKFRQYPTFQKILKRLLDPVCFTIIFTVSLQT